MSSFISSGSTALLYIKQTCLQPPHQTTDPGCTECLLSSKKRDETEAYCSAIRAKLVLGKKRNSGSPDFPERYSRYNFLGINWMYKMQSLIL